MRVVHVLSVALFAFSTSGFAEVKPGDRAVLEGVKTSGKVSRKVRITSEVLSLNKVEEGEEKTVKIRVHTEVEATPTAKAVDDISEFDFPMDTVAPAGSDEKIQKDCEFENTTFEKAFKVKAGTFVACTTDESNALESEIPVLITTTGNVPFKVLRRKMANAEKTLEVELVEYSFGK
jgi:hypothetical protein